MIPSALPHGSACVDTAWLVPGASGCCPSREAHKPPLRSSINKHEGENAHSARALAAAQDGGNQRRSPRSHPKPNTKHTPPSEPPGRQKATRTDSVHSMYSSGRTASVFELALRCVWSSRNRSKPTGLLQHEKGPLQNAAPVWEDTLDCSSVGKGAQAMRLSVSQSPLS